ncbi:13241_t:CDS:2, partial [Funneliformis mosseae]
MSKKLKISAKSERVFSFEELVQQAADIDNELHKLSDSLDEDSVITKARTQQTSRAFSSESKRLYIHGPSGLGNSYTLYYIVSQLRLQPEVCRVTYINSCDVWWNTYQEDPYEYLLNELICTFNMDKLPTKTIVEWANFVMQACGSEFRTSTNNEVFPKEFKPWKQLNLFGGYDDNEFNEWCKLYNYDIDGDLETKSQLEVIKFWTGAYPLELDIWHQTPGNNLLEKSQKYLANRKASIGLSHQSYIESLSIGREENLSKCITSMILQTVPPEMDYGMDRQLMHKDTIL